MLLCDIFKFLKEKNDKISLRLDDVIYFMD